MRVAAIQHDIVWEDPEANFKRLRPLIDEAANAGAGLISLTEMFSTGFSMDTEKTGESADGPSTTFLLEQAAATGAAVCGSLPELVPGLQRPFNQFVLAQPDGTLHRYAKIHPFSYGNESDHFTAGELPLNVEVEDLRVSPFVCYDVRFANVFWDAATSTDLYLVVANWPASRSHHWKSLLMARAIENQAYVVGVNRVGSGGKLDYSGDSLMIDPLGQILDETEPGNEAVLMADIDPQTVGEVRRQFPFLKDRRT